MKILFQGDSITDWNHNLNDPHTVGTGYVKYATETLTDKYPDIDFEFLNYGISGERIETVAERTMRDIIPNDPDIVSVLVGINNTWHRADTGKPWYCNKFFEDMYRFILDTVKAGTHAKILMLSMFLCDTPDKEFFRPDVNEKIAITKKLADEYKIPFVPLDKIFREAEPHNPLHWTLEGVHPTEAGARLIAKHYVDAISPIIESIGKNYAE